jgi:VWFA-related protein
MILMTDGMDNNSMVSYSEAVRAAVENDIAIYIVSITRALQNYLDYVLPQMGTSRDQIMFMMQREMAQGEAFLRRLAYDTGGRVLQSNNFGQLDDIYAEVTEELRNQYTLGYISTNTARDGSYREIDVGVSTRDAPNVRITARPGYYAPRN